MILLRRRPDRASVVSWLITVAIREAWRRSARERRDAHLEDLAAGDAASADGWTGVIAAPVSVDDAVEARRALEVLAALPERQRHDLALFVAGFRYAEIARLGEWRRSTNNVNKRLSKARSRIRRLEADAA